MKRSVLAVLAVAAVLCAAVLARAADPNGDPKAVSQDDGKWVDANGVPTFRIEGNKVDWYTYIGYMRYADNCLRCHGPDGLGSTYAPSLVDALQADNYGVFLQTVAGGKQAVSSSQQLVMPALGTDKNVMCFIDTIYVYLRARSDGALGRDRPTEHDPKPAGWSNYVDSCMGPS
jgi:methanol metabolism-related c-type cytochrome